MQPLKSQLVNEKKTILRNKVLKNILSNLQKNIEGLKWVVKCYSKQENKKIVQSYSS